MFLDDGEWICKCALGIETSFHHARPSRNHFWQNFLDPKFGLKSEFLAFMLDFACKNAIFHPTGKLIQLSEWVMGTNHFIQRHFGSISKASRARFSILFLLFEKMNFFHSQASKCSKIGFKVHILHVKNDFVGWKKFIFSKSKNNVKNLAREALDIDPKCL